MRVLVQRSLESSVTVQNKIVGKIHKGLVLLVGFTYNDSIEDIEYLVDKVIHLRIFDDEKGIMNKSILEVEGSILSVSQFTLYANTTKGRRPNYIESLKGEEALPLYEKFNEILKKEGIDVQTGIFGSVMTVNITGDGPVTILLESRKKND